MTKKNRKARRLQELYPGVKCRVLYQRDYMNLLVKYGLEPPEHNGPRAPAAAPDDPDVKEGRDSLGSVLAG